MEVKGVRESRAANLACTIGRKKSKVINMRERLQREPDRTWRKSVEVFRRQDLVRGGGGLLYIENNRGGVGV